MPTLLTFFGAIVLTACSEDTVSENSDNATAAAEDPTTLEGSTAKETTTPPAPDVFFPEQLPSDGLPPSARIRGDLVLDEAGCIRIDGGGPPYYLPLWPDYFELSTEGDEIRIVDGEGDFVARVGGRIDTGGGNIHHGRTPREIFEILQDLVGETTARELRQRCTGPYWLVGPSEDHIQYP